MGWPVALGDRQRRVATALISAGTPTVCPGQEWLSSFRDQEVARSEKELTCGRTQTLPSKGPRMGSQASERVIHQGKGCILENPKSYSEDTTKGTRKQESAWSPKHEAVQWGPPHTPGGVKPTPPEVGVGEREEEAAPTRSPLLASNRTGGDGERSTLNPVRM